MVSRPNSEDDLQEELESLRLALNGLRREHRELKDKVEARVLDYIEEEKEVMEELDRKIEGIGDILHEINANRARIREVEETLEGKARVEDIRERMADIEGESEAKDSELLARIRTLETRVDLIAERMD